MSPTRALGQVARLTEQVFEGEALSERSRAVLADLDDTLGSPG